VDAARPYIRNAWYVAFWSADLEPGTLHARTILDDPIVFEIGRDDRPLSR
jgi:phenylpropionate dioxygenase-like ring-hydroxylating dioxygenase large terminal subunit